MAFCKWISSRIMSGQCVSWILTYTKLSSPTLIHTTHWGQTLHSPSCSWKYGNAALLSSALFCPRGNFWNQLDSHYFSDHLFVVLSSLSAPISAAPCYLEMIRMCVDEIVHFSQICLDCVQPALWSSILASVNSNNISWLNCNWTSKRGRYGRDLGKASLPTVMANHVDSLNWCRICPGFLSSLCGRTKGLIISATRRNFINLFKNSSAFPCRCWSNATFSLTKIWGHCEKVWVCTLGAGPRLEMTLQKSLARNPATGVACPKPQAHFRPKCGPSGDSKENKPSSGSLLWVVIQREP